MIMANAVIIIVLIVVVCVAIRHIYRTIKHGRSCCGSSREMEKKVRVKDRNKSNYPFSYKVKVEGMVCAGCARRVENAVNADGGLWAKVDLEHKEVNVLAKREMELKDFVELMKSTPYTVLGIK